MWYISYNRILFGNKKYLNNEKYDNMGEPWKYYSKQKIPITKGNILYDSIYLKSPEWPNVQRQSTLVVPKSWAWEISSCNKWLIMSFFMGYKMF
jgi:hypothetical protein